MIHHAHNGIDCVWGVEAPIGYVVEFQLDEVRVPVIPGTVCSADFVEIKFREDLRLTGARFCHFGMSK
ncbi:hypothetical protein PFISCL1PPCAC_19384, partial [Pristionchus fissidentatus]